MLHISSDLLRKIHTHVAAAYPEEGAGLLLGVGEAGDRRVTALFEIENAREAGARHNRYLLTPEDYLRAELEAERQGLEVIGVFHSHPDHPNRPSEFDREWAMPFLSYVITSVHAGRAVESCSWLLCEDREKFIEEPIHLDGERGGTNEERTD